jgi:rhodanese-related sulfurtransferase
LTPAEVAERIRKNSAVLIDIREPDEFRRRHIPGALSRPLSAFETAHPKVEPSQDVVFTCKSGMRTAAACDRLAKVVDGPAHMLEGGVDAWAAAGLPITEDRFQPLEIMRQVQLGAGGLVLAGVALGLLVHPAFFGLAALVGAGLAGAGATGFCGMAKLLSVAPWNRPVRT